MGNCKINYGSTQIADFDATAPVAVTYNGSTIVSVASGETKTLSCSGKVASTNIVVGSKTLNCAGQIMSNNIIVALSGVSEQIGTATSKLSAQSHTITFSGISGTPKAFFIQAEAQLINRSSSTTKYCSSFSYDGSVHSATAAYGGSSGALVATTSNNSSSISGTTLTVTCNSYYFKNGVNYKLVYIY